MEKAHSRINWENYPSIATPLNEVNLNKMDDALNEVDNRVLGLDTAKLDKSTANTMVKDISFAESTGIFTITLLNGTKKTIDTKLEKIATNFSYDYQTQKLKLTLIDGTVQQIDLSSLISQLEFIDSDTIDITVDSSGKVSAIVKNGSITEEKLQPNFLADVKVEVAKAKSSSDSAYENATTARESAGEAERFRNEAEQFRNEAYSATPEGYDSLVGQVNKNTVAINTITEKAELNIKETAMGDNIHLIDSADGKNVEFALYGKATQNGTPTPQNPVDIEVAGSDGSVEVKSVGKNLLKNTVASQSVDGVTFTVNDDCSVYAKGTAKGVQTFDIPITLEKGSYKASIGFNGNSNTAGFQVYRKSDSYFFLNENKPDGSEFTVQEKTLCVFRLRIGNGATVDTLFKPMIRLATDTDSNYEPYKETLSTISTENGLAGIPVSSGGNYTDQSGQQWICDEIVKYADGSGEKIQRVGKTVLNGSEGITWTVKDDGIRVVVYCNPNALWDKHDVSKRYDTNILCNCLIGDLISSGINSVYFDNNWLNMSLDIGYVTSSDEFNAWLTNNNLEFWYELAEPIRTPLTQEQLAEIEKLSTFYPVTNISNDFDCGMKVKYIVDPKNYIDNRLALIEQAMLNSI